MGSSPAERAKTFVLLPLTPGWGRQRRRLQGGQDPGIVALKAGAAGVHRSVGGEALGRASGHPAHLNGVAAG